MNKPPKPTGPYRIVESGPILPPTRPEMPAVRPETTDAILLREFRQLVGMVDNLGNQLVDHREETRAEIAEIKERIGKHSVGVNRTSQNDLRQDAAIATMLAEQAAAKTRDEALAKALAANSAALAANTILTDDVKKTVGGWLKHPVVVAFAMAALAFATAWLQRHT
jgi:hypothetical protein